MTVQENCKAVVAAPVAGDVETLARRLGVWDPRTDLGGWEAWSAPAGGVVGAEGVRRFLEDYGGRCLVPLEWPGIVRAWALTSEGRGHELVQFDREWGGVACGFPFLEASRAVGRRQLGRLRPLRDARAVQRYVRAVDEGLASGWHVVVYGAAVATFSIPLRQGLMHFASQVLAGLAARVPVSEGIPEAVRAQCLDEALATVSARLGTCLPERLPATGLP